MKDDARRGTYSCGPEARVPRRGTHPGGVEVRAPRQGTHSSGAEARAPRQGTYSCGGVARAPRRGTYPGGAAARVPALSIDIPAYPCPIPNCSGGFLARPNGVLLRWVPILLWLRRKQTGGLRSRGIGLCSDTLSNIASVISVFPAAP
jgi:hypothetical protein